MRGANEYVWNEHPLTFHGMGMSEDDEKRGDEEKDGNGALAGNACISWETKNKASGRSDRLRTCSSAMAVR